MTLPPPRPPEVRKADALAQLTAEAADVWVATASADAAVPPHLVPVSLAWLEDRAVIALARGSRTARDLRAQGRARLGVGPTRDVVMLDAVVEDEHEADQAGDLAAAYARQADWDPRTSPGYVYFVLRPERIQAWREVNEIPGRTLMRDGRWLV